MSWPLPLMISLNVYARSDASRPAHIMNFHLTAVNEDKDIPAAKNMIENLVQGQETVVKTALLQS
jgi:hypothetical protein